MSKRTRLYEAQFVPQLMSPQMAGQMLGIDKRTIQKMIHQGHLRATKVPMDGSVHGFVWRIYSEDIMKFIEEAKASADGI